MKLIFYYLFFQNVPKDYFIYYDMRLNQGRQKVWKFQKNKVALVIMVKKMFLHSCSFL